MSQSYLPLSHKSLYRGQFLDELDRLLGELDDEIIKHAQKYSEGHKGGKASLTVEISTIWEKRKGMDDPVWGVSVEWKFKRAAMPPCMRAAVLAEKENGAKALFVNSSPPEESAIQLELFNKFHRVMDGASVDFSTGEVVDGDPVDGKPAGTLGQ